MRFKELESISFFSNIFSTVILIVLAYLGWSFWSLVISSLIGGLIQAVILLFLSRINARLCLKGTIVLQYFKSGTIIYSTALLTYFHSSLDTMLIGKISGLVILGYYTVGKEWARYFHNMLFAHLSQILFPGYAHIQDDRHRLACAVQNVFRIAVPIMWPCYIGFLFIAPDFIRIFLGEKWVPTIALLQILLFSMCFESVGWIFGPVSDAIGRFDIRLKLVLYNVVALALLFPLIGYFYGVLGYGVAVLSVSISSFMLSFWFVCKKELGITWKTLWHNIRNTFMSVCLMSMVLIAINISLKANHAGIRLAIMIGSGVCSYFIFSYLLNRALLKEYVTLLQTLFLKKKNITENEGK
jgi:O-antigen/teichoic acid export membrane protein